MTLVKAERDRGVGLGGGSKELKQALASVVPRSYGVLTHTLIIYSGTLSTQ